MIGVWDTWFKPAKCGSIDCGATIGAGECFRRVGAAVVCAACASRRFGVTVPDSMPAQHSAAGFRERLKDWAPVSDMADWKQKQLAEREPGEEG